MTLRTPLTTLYETNYLQWLEETIYCLQSRQLDTLDLINSVHRTHVDYC